MIDTDKYTTRLTKLIPEGRVGKFRIKKTIIPRGTRIRMYHPSGYLYHDEFNSDFPTVRLLEKDGSIWMSDTPMEQESLVVPSILAKGNVLVLGLGLGLFPQLLRKRRRVRKITIIEKETDVVILVYPCIKLPKTEVVISDAKAYIDFAAAVGYRYDFIYVDIWSGILAPLKVMDEWVEIAKPVLAPGGVVYCWLRELYDRVKDKLPKEPVTQPGFPNVYDPCLICGKTLRNDYAGLCMDCADELDVSEIHAEKHDRK